MQENRPLVSVPVVTYNSSKTVLETLESIKAQTYHNIELIISDDCSTDNTVSICRKWVDLNQKRFVRTVFLESKYNTGVSSNVNRAEDACQGKWVKFIAGDDVLLEDCIDSYLSYISEYPEAKYIFGRMDVFGGTEEKRRYINNEVFKYELLNESVDKQLTHLLLDKNYIPAPTLFYDLQYVRNIKLRCDERIPLLDDWPKWINALKKGVIFNFLDKVTVKYRISDGALSTGTFSDQYKQSKALFFIYYQFLPQFLNTPSSFLFKKKVYAHHISGKTNFFWDIIWLVWNGFRKCLSRNEVMSFF